MVRAEGVKAGKSRRGGAASGPALAFWLERYGYDVTVIERAPAPRPGGYAVDFRGASLKVLDRMGLLAAVEAIEAGKLYSLQVKRL